MLSRITTLLSLLRTNSVCTGRGDVHIARHGISRAQPATHPHSPPLPNTPNTHPQRTVAEDVPGLCDDTSPAAPSITNRGYASPPIIPFHPRHTVPLTPEAPTARHHTSLGRSPRLVHKRKQSPVGAPHPLPLADAVRRRILLATRYSLLATAFALCANAQTIRWEPNSGSLGYNQFSELSLVFENCSPTDGLQIPTPKNLSFSGQPNHSQQNSFQMGAGGMTGTRTIRLTYQVRPTTRDPIAIPAFTVKTDKGNITVPSASFTVGDATLANTTIPIDTIATANLTTGSTEIWSGQTLPLSFQLNAHKNFLQDLSRSIEWNPEPLSIEEWAQPHVAEQTISGEPRVLVTQTTTALAPTVTTPQKVTLQSPSKITIFRLSTGRQSLFAPFNQPATQDYPVAAKPLSLLIKPLPSPAPQNFSGIIGTFTLEATAVPQTVALGDPITWTLTLNGTGNWPAITALPPRSLSRDFKTITPQPKRTIAPGKLYEGNLTEDIVLIPTKPGTYTLPATELTVFNPKTGSYQTLKTQPITLTITQPTTTTTGTSSTPPPATPQQQNPFAPKSPNPDLTPTDGSSTQIPNAPFTAPKRGFAPLQQNPFLASLLVFPAFLILFWLTLALLRARKTDPRLPLRRAKKQLQKLLPKITAQLNNTSNSTDTGTSTNTLTASISSALNNTSSTTGTSTAASPKTSPLAALLLQWQHLTAQLHNLTQSTPTPSDLPTSEAAQLWRESDSLIYGNPTKTQLPPDWPDRAAQSLRATRISSFNPLRLFLPSNLFALPISASKPTTLLALIITTFILLPGTSTHAQTTPSLGGAMSTSPDATSVAPTQHPETTGTSTTPDTPNQSPANVPQTSKPAPAPTQTTASLPSTTLIPLTPTPTTTATSPTGAAAPSDYSLATSRYSLLDGVAAYTTGNFTAAAETYRQLLQQSPRDPALRYNLSLALSQQNQWPEASAHALSAWLQSPRDPQIRAQLSYTLNHAGFIPRPLQPFLQPKPPYPQLLASQLSPACWQHLLVAAALIATLSLATLLHSLFTPKKRFFHSLFLHTPLLILSLLTAAAAGTSLHAYGNLSDPRLTLITKSDTLRSIPTDLDTQKTTPIAAGHLALTTKIFLTWQHLQLPNTQSAWLPTNSQTPLYQPPPLPKKSDE